MTYDPTKPDSTSAAKDTPTYIREAVSVSKTWQGTTIVRTALTDSNVQEGSLYYDTDLNVIYRCGSFTNRVANWLPLTLYVVWGYIKGTNQNGACQIMASDGITSVARVAAGGYRVTMSVAKADANYAVMALPANTGQDTVYVSENRQQRTTALFEINFYNSDADSYVDPPYFSVFVYR